MLSQKQNSVPTWSKLSRPTQNPSAVWWTDASAACSPERLAGVVGRPDAPPVLDVRIAEDVAARPEFLPQTVRIDGFEIARTWPRVADYCTGRPGPAVIMCHRGAKLSQGVAALLTDRGVPTCFLTGGVEAWCEAGHITTTLAPSTLATAEGDLADNSEQPPCFVLGRRPKLAGLVSAWATRRFIASDAVIMTVDADQVALVADRFGARVLPDQRSHARHDYSPDAAAASMNAPTFSIVLLAALGLNAPLLVSFLEALDPDRDGPRPLAHRTTDATTGRLSDVVEGMHISHANDTTVIEAALPMLDALYAQHCQRIVTSRNEGQRV